MTIDERTVFFRSRTDQRALVGVGFIVAPRWIATCAHVVSDHLGDDDLRHRENGPEERVECIGSDNSRKKFSGYVRFWDPLSLQYQDEPISATHDLALIEIKESAGDDAATQKWDYEQLEYHGDDVLSFGVPVFALGPYLPEGASDEDRIEDGRVDFTVLRSFDTHSRLHLRYVSTSAYPARPGLSGTPVFTEDGYILLGIIDRVSEGSSATAIPISSILAALGNQDPGLDLPQANDRLLTFDFDLPVDFRRNFSQETREAIAKNLKIMSSGSNGRALGKYLENSGALPFVVQALHNSQEWTFDGGAATSRHKPLTVTVRRFEKFARHFLMSTDVSMLKGLHQLYPMVTRKISDLSEDIMDLYEKSYEGQEGVSTRTEENFCNAASRRVKHWRDKLYSGNHNVDYANMFLNIITTSSPALLRRLVALRVMYSDQSSNLDEDALQGLKNLVDDRESAGAEVFGDKFNLVRFESEWLSPLYLMAEQMKLKEATDTNGVSEEAHNETAQNQTTEFIKNFLVLVRETSLLHWAVERFKLSMPYENVSLKADEYDTIRAFAHLGETRVVMLSDFFIQELLNASSMSIEDA